MNKYFDKQKVPIVVGIIVVIALIVVLVSLISAYSISSANLGRQQQWTSDKDSFDRAFEIAVSDKEDPDKTLNVPNLCDQIGKTVDEAVKSIGQGATVISTNSEVDRDSGAVSKTIINLNNESGNEKTGTPNVVAYTNRSGKIVKISFSCNTWLLGYGGYSFVDMLDYGHIVENTLNEAGLNLTIPSLKAPQNRALYTNYESDGTTVISENCDFDGYCYQNGHNYKWSSNLNFDYTIANSKGDLSETIRIISITIQ